MVAYLKIYRAAVYIYCIFATPPSSTEIRLFFAVNGD